MFIREYRVNHYNTFPKFHLVKCKTIDEFIKMGIFNSRYEWSNSNVNDIIDPDTQVKYENKVLELCKNCKDKILNEINDTEDFFRTLDTNEINETTIEVDIFGYTKNWQKISETYRKKKNYTCEECKIKIENPIDKRYLHVHHKDGNKLNNAENNLQCLCVLCHSHVDVIHEENFNKQRLHAEVTAFVKKYKDILKSLGNKHLKEFDKSL